MEYKVGSIVKVSDLMINFIGVIEEISHETNFRGHPSIFYFFKGIGYELNTLSKPNKLEIAIYLAKKD